MVIGDDADPFKGKYTWRVSSPEGYYHLLVVNFITTCILYNPKCKIPTHIEQKVNAYYPNLSFPLNNNNHNIIIFCQWASWFSSFMFKLHDVGNIALAWTSRCNDKHEGSWKCSLQSHTLYFMLLNVCRVSTILHEFQPFMWYYCLNVIIKGLVNLDYNRILALQ